MRRRSFIALPLCAVSVLAIVAVTPSPDAVVRADLHCLPSEVIELAPVADTWFEVAVGTGAPVNPTPQGASDRLQAGWSDVGIVDYAVMRFALPAQVAPEQVQRAQLEVHILAADILSFGPPLPVSGTLSLGFGQVLDSWDEATLSSPAPPRVLRGVLRTETEWHPCRGAECGTALADVTPLVRAWLGGEAENNGLALQVAGSLGEQAVVGTVFDFASRESDHPPTLRLTTGAGTSAASMDLWLPFAARYVRTPIPTRAPAEGRYLLVERWANWERGPGCGSMQFGFPLYRFDRATGELHLWVYLGSDLALEPADVGYFASVTSISGRGWGAASAIKRIVGLPFQTLEMHILSVDGDGAVAMTLDGDPLALPPGRELRWQSVSPRDETSCVITTTVRLTNYGFQDRAKIVYNR